MKKPAIQVHDDRIAKACGEDIIVGDAFAFMTRAMFDRPEIAWVQRLAEPRVCTVPILGLGADLPGVTLKAAPTPQLSLKSITSDKALYREGKDVVHLLALDALSPNAARELVVSTAGTELVRVSVELGPSGAAAVDLRDLPTGSYTICFEGQPKPKCELTVAEYRLAPLVASLRERSLSGDELTVTLMLETFGVAVQGEVTLELMDGDRRVTRTTARTEDGEAKASFELKGEGPFSINVQLVDHSERTATVPIVGARADERSDTVFSTLGTETLGTLLPSEGARSVRGVYLREGAACSTPFALERVDTRRARLVAKTDVEAVSLIAINPAFPLPGDQAVDPKTAADPRGQDELYRSAQQLFEEKKWTLARGVFESARDKLPAAKHPNYAYYIACCHAYEGHVDEALAWMRRTVADGWRDMDHVRGDDDLEPLRGRPEWEEILRLGMREERADRLAAGEAIEIDVAEPLGLLAIGAFVDGKPFEGWAATSSPSALSVEVRVPETTEPGEQLAIEIEARGVRGAATAYVVVKDARLLSSDTPGNQLAGELKSTVGRCQIAKRTRKPEETLASRLPPPFLPPFASRGGPPPPPGMAPPMMGMAPRMAAAPGGPPGAYAPPPPMAAPASAPAAPRMMRSMALGSTQGAMPMDAVAGGAAPASPYRDAPEPPVAGDDPEVVFAGPVELEDGRGTVEVTLGDAFADYVIEAFVTTGLDWNATETRTRAVKDPFISLDLPPFVHAEDGAVGRLIAGAQSGRLRVSVTRDGAPVDITDGTERVTTELDTQRAELSFVAGPGDYIATVIDPASGASDAVALRVDEPGKLRRFSRTVQLLEPGQELRREDGVRSLKVLPGLDGPFKALVDATGDYSHACCEQTAAKMLAALAMLLLEEKDGRRRARGESIFMAGLRREQRMWLRGRGFKMYPESSDSPNEYWGPKATRYLFEADIAKGMGGLSRDLRAGLESCLEMAHDTAQGYAIEWPPKRPNSLQEAYAIVRADGRKSGDALDRARALATAKGSGGRVAVRADNAFGAAALLRGGAKSDLAVALDLANRVISQLDERGRLYSTVDSVAAIALMSELQRAGVVSAGGNEVEINGKRMSSARALAFEGDIEHLVARDGVTAVEVERIVEEDWSSFASDVSVRIALEKNGKATRSIAVGDAIDLRVRLGDGYQAGDLAWVCLPDALTRVIGGGRVKRFSVDFEEKDEVVVPLVATGPTVSSSGEPAPQRFAACVRNMFEEERAGSPGLLQVTVTSKEEVGGIFARIKKLFS